MKSGEEKCGIPKKLRVKRRDYTLTPAALEARHQNAQKSTGPNSGDGKKASARNSWKHGLYAKSFILGALGKPCQRTCDKFLTCSLVQDDAVSPGETCLDKQFVAESFDAIIQAIELKKTEDFNHIAALEMAGVLQIIRKAREDIIEDGIVIKSEKQDKDGNVIGFEYRPHPALAIYSKMILDFGLTPDNFLMTPKSIAKAAKDTDDAEIETSATIMSRALRKIVKPDAQ